MILVLFVLQTNSENGSKSLSDAMKRLHIYDGNKKHNYKFKNIFMKYCRFSYSPTFHQFSQAYLYYTSFSDDPQTFLSHTHKVSPHRMAYGNKSYPWLWV